MNYSPKTCRISSDVMKTNIILNTFTDLSFSAKYDNGFFY